ncbi:hypothetical protein E4Z66_03385 [Aliishimia ponticola]|uniref:Uncharacterized protein n=1 Tax=Aliishimia ponticola TaxID=2499833 RepID=A0A4S4NIB3_9RHOB|nr:hypothetical protein [Aliishimia ponticola]THH38625.1 hypothetical protein E4Z66_03385 [Aliishimia ponticola]
MTASTAADCVFDTHTTDAPLKICRVGDIVRYSSDLVGWLSARVARDVAKAIKLLINYLEYQQQKRCVA